MFIGNKETQQAASQKLLEAVVHLRRASDALMAVQPIFKEEMERTAAKNDRHRIAEMADAYDNAYVTSAREAFK
jgi:hypothetical protein